MNSPTERGKEGGGGVGGWGESRQREGTGINKNDPDMYLNL